MANISQQFILIIRVKTAAAVAVIYNLHSATLSKHKCHLMHLKSVTKKCKRETCKRHHYYHT